MIRIPRRHLEARAKDRPADYLDVCAAAGAWEGDELVLTPEAYASLCFRYAGEQAPRKPGFTEMVMHFGAAIKEWAEAGFPVVSAVQFHGRVFICQDCEFWRATPIPHCGVCRCSAIKQWLATSACPKGKW